MPLRVALTLLVRDENDLIRTNLEYHLAQGVDRILVTDNGSRDGTLETLREFEALGLVELFRESPSDFSQHRWVTRLARRAFETGADWVINGDADEFFVFSGGTLREALDNVPAGVSRLIVRRHDFVPHERPCEQAPPVEMLYRKSVSLNLAGQPLPPKTIHRAVPDVVVTQGNHDAMSARFPSPPHDCVIEVLHYPIRTWAQFKSKVVNGGSGYARNRELPQETGFHKRHWYRLYLEGKLAREYRDRLFYGAERLQEALRSGEVVEDRTLARRLGVPASVSGEPISIGP